MRHAHELWVPLIWSTYKYQESNCCQFEIWSWLSVWKQCRLQNRGRNRAETYCCYIICDQPNGWWNMKTLNVRLSLSANFMWIEHSACNTTNMLEDGELHCWLWSCLQCHSFLIAGGNSRFVIFLRTWCTLWRPHGNGGFEDTRIWLFLIQNW